MADFNSALPIRSELTGQSVYEDIIIKLGDATNPTTQQAAVDTFGSQNTIIRDASGNAINSQNLSATYWLQIVGPSNGPASPGTAANFSDLIGGIYNTSPPTLTNGQQASLQLDASGRLLVDAAVTFPYDTNYGVVGVNTLRTAAEIGNATGAADFNNGVTGAQTLRVAANLALGGTNVSATNPVPVAISSVPLGTSVNNYNLGSSVAAGSTSNHIYTITSGKTFQGKKIWATASGALKIEVQISPDGSTYSTLWVGFNSTATPNISIDMDQLVFLESGVGSTVQVIRTNEDKKAMDVYSTISGTEV